MKQKIGFMGLGIMGSPMAANILRAGYPVTVYNRSEQKGDEVVKRGAQRAASPKSLAEGAEVIFAMVTGPEALNELLWGTDGAAQAFNANKVFINMSTVSPKFTRELFEKLLPTGVTFIDAPVSGSKKPAEDATLVILAGGRKEDVDTLTPLLETMGKRVVYCGEIGQGSMMKLTINLLLGAMMEGLCEVVNFGKSAGLSLDAMLEVVSNGPLNAAIYQMKADMLRNNDFPVQFPLKHMTKDLKFLVDTAYDLGTPVPVGQMLLHLYRIGVAQNWGDLDFAAIMKVLDHLNATE
jgi:3-hydroxyisobutyrate dehydrogenase-like beta-hydroxyacid dehydrogenase